jgi:DNA-binding MarR family transcriptional regulator
VGECPDATRERLIDEFGIEVAEFQNATDAVDEAAAAWLGIHRTDLRSLGILFFRGPMTAGELADAVSLSPGAVTALIDRLERAGYAARVRDETDRRRVLLEVTPHAIELTAQVWGPIVAEGRARTSRYSNEEIELIRGFLQAGCQLQERHAARIRALPRPGSEGRAIRET